MSLSSSLMLQLRLAPSGHLEQRLVDSDPNATDDATESKSRLSSLTLYYLARCDMAVADSNYDLAFSMIQKAAATDPDGTLGGHNVLNISHKMFTIGEVLRKDPTQVGDAITWFSLAIDTLERAKNLGPVLGLEELQMALLRSATRVELLKPLDDSNLERVGKMLSDLVAVTNTLDPRNVHDVKVLQLLMLQQQQATEEDVREALSAIIETVTLTEETVVELLGEIASLAKYPDLQRFARQELLNKAVAVRAGTVHISRIIVGILIGVRKLEKDKQTALRATKQALNKLAAAEVELDGKATAAACQTIIWGFGEMCAKTNNFSHAAEWYALGCHKALMPWGRDGASMCRRKAALCCINAGDFVAAQAHLEQCPATEASTHYLGFLIAAQQGRELAAVSAIGAILNCKDLDSKQLLLMVQVSMEKKMHGALVKSLQTLLEALNNPDLAASIHTHSITLLRCLIESTVAQMRAEGSSEELAVTFVSYMHSASEVVSHLYSSGEAAEYAKEIARVYKTAFNVGVTGAMSWPPALVAELFDHTAMIISWYQAIAPIDCDPEIAVHSATAMFACLQGKMTVYSEMEAGDEKTDLADRLLAYIVHVRMAIDNTDSPGTKAEPFDIMARTLVQHEVALICDNSNWDMLRMTVEELISKVEQQGSDGGPQRGDPRMNLISVVSVMTHYRHCPTQLTCLVLERVLECAPLKTPADIVNYARWTRSLVLSLLHRGGEENGGKAFNLVTKAKEVIAAPGGADAYPDDEVEWLVSTTWGQGAEHLRYKRYAQGQHWCVLAIGLCLVAPSAYHHSEVLKGNYVKMLERAGFKPDVKMLGA
ncbi:sporulation-specific protein 22 [Vanrija albida]|uniref:Sporulation-specific protein 22 n=1 Tax=Vanrija albida TaxID=181172 RepID=A0ABR3Q3N0_9TREE